MSAKKAKAAGPTSEVIVAYKGFDRDLCCTGGKKPFQYAIGETYTHKGEVSACNSGFHACEYPLDVFGYYAPGKLSRYAQAEQSGDLSRHSGDSKVASRTIKIGAEIGIPGLVRATFEYTIARCEPSKAEHATGDQSASSATGYQSASSATGDRSASLVTGSRACAEIKPNTNDKNQGAVACALGYACKARAPIGSGIVLAERDSIGNLLALFSEIAGRNGIKPDTWYALKGGVPVIVEVEGDE